MSCCWHVCYVSSCAPCKPIQGFDSEQGFCQARAVLLTVWLLNNRLGAASRVLNVPRIIWKLLNLNGRYAWSPGLRL